MRVIKFLLNNFALASRDKREVQVLYDMGCEVEVYYPKYGKEFQFGNFKLNDLNLIQLNQTQPSLLRKIYILRNEYRSLKAARNFSADVISCHDIRALRIMYLATFMMKKKPKLVYDSHEFEIERSGKRGKFGKFVIKHLERFLIKRCAFSIMVNDSIAERVQEIHRLSEKPVVVRNIPPFWEIDEKVCKEQRERFLQAMNQPEDTFLLMYHGALMVNRGIESLIEQVKRNPHTAGVILGNGDESYVRSLQDLAKRSGVKERILFHSAVPQQELWKYVGAVDVGMVTVLNSCVSYYYMLPNKFFENIQSLTPIIGSAFPEVKRLIEQYQIGLTCDPSDMDKMAECVEKMRTDRDFYTKCKMNLHKAKAELNWEKERKILEVAYGKIM